MKTAVFSKPDQQQWRVATQKGQDYFAYLEPYQESSTHPEFDDFSSYLLSASFGMYTHETRGVGTDVCTRCFVADHVPIRG